MTYVDLTTVNDIFEAQMVAGALEEEGIPCIEANGNTATILPHLRQGIQIRVKDTDYLRAKVICDRLEQMRILRCPNCDSSKLIYKGATDRRLKPIEALLSVLHFPVKKHLLLYNCRDCGLTFKVN